MYVLISDEGKLFFSVLCYTAVDLLSHRIWLKGTLLNRVTGSKSTNSFTQRAVLSYIYTVTCALWLFERPSMVLSSHQIYFTSTWVKLKFNSLKLPCKIVLCVSCTYILHFFYLYTFMEVSFHIISCLVSHNLYYCTAKVILW